MAVPGTKKRSKGDSTPEIVLAAVLSILLGGVLGAAMLIFKPVPSVKEVPKDAAADAVYYLPGATDSGRAGEAESAQRAFASGAPVSVDETVLNAVAAQLYAKPDAAAQKPDQPKPPVPTFSLDAGAPNVRIGGGVLHLASKVKLAVYGQECSVLVQASGSFGNNGSGVVFSPDRIYVGSLQVQRFPVIAGLVIRRLLLPHPLPGSLADAWARLSTAAIDGSRLRLSP